MHPNVDFAIYRFLTQGVEPFNGGVQHDEQVMPYVKLLDVAFTSDLPDES